MGNSYTKSKVRKDEDVISEGSHFSVAEVQRLRKEFTLVADNGNITKEQFKKTLENHVQCWSAGAQYLFMERLFDAFDLDGNHSIDFEEFIQGLGVFIKGTPEEKMELSFRMYDIDKSGEVEKKEMISVMGRLYATIFSDDQTAKIKQTVERLFDDLDVDGNGVLSLAEYKLMALKEPMILDFLEQFVKENTDSLKTQQR